MSEDFQIEDGAEKVAERPYEVLANYLSEHGAAGKEKLIDILIERCDLSRDEAERIVEAHIKRRRKRFRKHEGGDFRSYTLGKKLSFPKKVKIRPRRKAKARIESVLKLPPDPHTLPIKSHFLARDDPSQLYYHPAMDQDKLAYLRAKEKMGAGADWPA